MIEKVPALARLCKELQRVPYLASKNLYKVATYFLTEDPQRVEQLCQTIAMAKQTIIACPTCCVWKEKEKPCVFCDDIKRDHTLICVVETWQELSADDLSITALVGRVSGQTECQEVIFAMNQTPEGEATSAFIARKLKETHIKVSCLARGIPVGSHLEMMDKLTVYKALSERRPF
jgi:recombination protein RecR